MVRPNVAAAMRPQVFPVNVPAVLVDGNQRTNVVLQSDDQVYVGETRQSSLSRLLPNWLGIAYRRVTGLLPDDWWPFGKAPRAPVPTSGSTADPLADTSLKRSPAN